MSLVILAGGFATRLRPLTLTRPKPLLPILDRPLLEWILSDVSREGVFSRIVLSLHNMADQIISYVKNRWSVLEGLLRHVIEERPLGDGGALINIVEKLGGEVSYPLTVINGDLFMKISFRDLLDYHKKRGGLATIVATYVDDVSRYGLLKTSGEDLLLEIVEKPRELAGRRGLVNAGVYVFSREALDIIVREYSRSVETNTSRKIGLARDVIPRLIERGDVYVYRYSGVWSDIGTPGDYFRANIEAIEILSDRRVYIDPSARIDGDVKIQAPVYIGRDVVIRGGSVIGPRTVLMTATSVGRGVYTEDAIVMSESSIGDYSMIKGAIIGEKNMIGRWARIYRDVVLGSSVYTGDHVCIPPRTRVLPYKELEEDLCQKRLMTGAEPEEHIII